MSAGGGWSAEAEAILRAAIADRLSSARARDRLKAAGVIKSRSAVIGKARRMGLSFADGKCLPAPPEAQRLASRHESRRRGTAPPPRRGPASGRGSPVSLAALGPRQCRWPIGDPGREGFGFCGRRQVRGSSYCATHRRQSLLKGGRDRCADREHRQGRERRW